MEEVRRVHITMSYITVWEGKQRGKQGMEAQVTGIQGNTSVWEVQSAVRLPRSLWRKINPICSRTWWDSESVQSLGWLGHWETQEPTQARPVLKPMETTNIQQLGPFSPPPFKWQQFCVSWQPWTVSPRCPRSLASLIGEQLGQSSSALCQTWLSLWRPGLLGSFWCVFHLPNNTAYILVVWGDCGKSSQPWGQRGSGKCLFSSWSPLNNTCRFFSF